MGSRANRGWVPTRSRSRHVFCGDPGGLKWTTTKNKTVDRGHAKCVGNNKADWNTNTKKHQPDDEKRVFLVKLETLLRRMSWGRLLFGSKSRLKFDHDQSIWFSVFLNQNSEGGCSIRMQLPFFSGTERPHNGNPTRYLLAYLCSQWVEVTYNRNWDSILIEAFGSANFWTKIPKRSNRATCYFRVQSGHTGNPARYCLVCLWGQWMAI